MSLRLKIYEFLAYKLIPLFKKWCLCCDKFYRGTQGSSLSIGYQQPIQSKLYQPHAMIPTVNTKRTKQETQRFDLVPRFAYTSTKIQHFYYSFQGRAQKRDTKMIEISMYRPIALICLVEVRFASCWTLPHIIAMAHHFTLLRWTYQNVVLASNALGASNVNVN